MDEARKKGDAKRKTEEEKERKKKEAKAEKDLLEFACKVRLVISSPFLQARLHFSQN